MRQRKHPADRFGSRRSALKSVHWTDLPRCAGRASPFREVFNWAGAR